MRKNMIKTFKLLFVVLLLTPFTSSCSQRDQLQPVETNVWLVSEKREIAIGEEVAKEVEREYSVYQDAELTAYVDRIGQVLARNSDRPHIQYKFKVLDSPIANAFATPGGHVYITRGILGILDDEAELAGVVGHEVGHVAARHSAKQIQNATLTQIGFTALALVLGDKVNDDMWNAIGISTNLIFLGYSRGDEDQADILGAKYLYRSGYDPNGMIGAMEGILELEKRNPMKAEQFLQSHPLTKDRVEHIKSWIPRIQKEDVWGGIPPGTNIRGVESFQRIAAPHAQYQGGEEMAAVIENLRIGVMRGQKDLVERSLDDNYRDDNGKTKSDYMSELSSLLSQAKRITYKFSNIETEPRRTGGVAKCDYQFEVLKTNGTVTKENGRIYFEFVKPEPFVWKITSIRKVVS